MTKLNDTQLVLLSKAAKRDDSALVRSPKLKPEATEQAAAALLARKLVKAIPKTGSLPLWKKGPEGEPISLVITPKGLETIGVDGLGDPKQPSPVVTVTTPQPAKIKAAAPVAAKAGRGAKAKPGGLRPTSKIAKVVDMLRKPGGASIKAIMAATGWQAHSVRGAIAGAIKKKLGLKVLAETKNDERVYRIGG